MNECTSENGLKIFERMFGLWVRQGAEVKRRSLTQLGTLRSRRESFTESKSEADLDKKSPPKDKPVTIADIPDTKVAEKNKSDLSLPDSDWGSEDSLPLDRSAGGAAGARETVAVDVHQDSLAQPASPAQLLQVAEPTGSAAVSPEPLSERRARMMLMQQQQSVDLTLTEDKTDDKTDDHSGGSSTGGLPPEVDGDQVGL